MMPEKGCLLFTLAMVTLMRTLLAYAQIVAEKYRERPTGAQQEGGRYTSRTHGLSRQRCSGRGVESPAAIVPVGSWAI